MMTLWRGLRRTLGRHEELVLATTVLVMASYEAAVAAVRRGLLD